MKNLRYILPCIFLLSLSSFSYGNSISNWLYNTFSSLASYFEPQTYKGKIIVMSGASSSGKSSAANALQNLYAEKNIPYLLIHNDELISGFPKKWVDLNPKTHNPSKMNPEGLIFKKIIEDSMPKIDTTVGNLIIDMFKATTEALKAFSHNDINVIFEGVFDIEGINYLKENLNALPIHYIGIKASLEIAEQREKERGGFEGMTRGQHRDCIINGEKTLCFIDPKEYDFVVDTSEINPQEAAQEIYDYLQSKE